MNNAMESIKTYFKGVKAEWSRVSWPEKNQVVGETISVIFIVAAFTVAILVMDIVFKWFLGFIK